MEDLTKTVLGVLETVAIGQHYNNYEIKVKQVFRYGNFCSFLFSSTISAPGKEDLKLFVKLAALGEKLRELFPVVYKTEIYFYTKLIKTYRLLEEKHNIPDEKRIRTIKFYGSSLKESEEILVLEDLRAKGFISFDRSKSITWEQAADSVAQLAKLHALSLCLLKESPLEFKILKQGLLPVMSENGYRNMFNSVKSRVLEATEEIDRKRIDIFMQNVYKSENFHFLFKPIKKEIIIHGDFRTDNLMYKHENGSCQVVPLDLQTLFCGSPTLDLMHLIDLGADYEFRKKYFQATIDHYYTELCAALRRLNVDPKESYSQEDFYYELKEIMPFTAMFGMIGLLVVSVDEDVGIKDLQNFGVEDFAYSPNQLFKMRLKEYIQFYTEKGVIPL